MSEATTHSTVLIVAFDDADKAKKAYQSAQSAEKEHAVDIQDIVLVTKDEKGRAHIADARHRATKEGAIVGGTLGFLLGLGLGGPIGATLVGAAAGGLVGNIGEWAGQALHVGFSKDEIEQVTESLQAGEAAVLVHLTRGNPEMISAAVRDSGGKVLEFTVTDEMEANINDGWSAAIERDR